MRESLALTGALTAAATRLWWRRLAARLGTPASVAICVVALGGGVLFWRWVWPQVQAPIAEVIEARPGFECALIVAVVSGYGVIVALLRVLMLAFDTMSQDLRIIVATAPLSRFERAMVALVPDLGASLIGSLFVGSVALFACASVAPHFGYAEALGWGIALVIAIGGLATALELGATALGRDVQAARAASSIGTLMIVCGAMIWVGSSLEENPVDGGAARLGARFLSLGAPLSLACAAWLALLGLLAWCLSAAWTTHVLFHARGHRPRLRVPTGSIAASSAVSFLRDAGNRFGMVSLAALIAAGFWIESTSGLTVGGQITVMAFVLVVTGSAVISYGDFLSIRWRVHASPAATRRAVFAWLAGHLGAAAAIAAVGLAVLAIVRRDAFTAWTGSDWATLASVSLTGLGSGLLAGRILPYEKEDVFSISGTGFVDLLVGLSTYWVTGRLAGLLGLPTLVFSALFATAAITAVVRGERRRSVGAGSPRRRAPVASPAS